MREKEQKGENKRIIIGREKTNLHTFSLPFTTLVREGQRGCLATTNSHISTWLYIIFKTRARSRLTNVTIPGTKEAQPGPARVPNLPPTIADPICGHAAPYSVAFNVPPHGGCDCGGRHRRSPTGGLAYGIPKYLVWCGCVRGCFVRGSAHPIHSPPSWGDSCTRR